MRMMFVPVAAVALAGCGREPASDGESATTANAAAASATPANLAAPATPAGCSLIPRAEIERIAGPLDGEPVPEDRGCWHYVVMDTTTPKWRALQDGARRARASGMDERAIAMYHPTRAGIYAEVDARGEGMAAEERPEGTPPGWDEARLSPSGAVFHGRTGHVRVSVKVQQLELSPDTVLAIASRVRD